MWTPIASNDNYTPNKLSNYKHTTKDSNQPTNASSIILSYFLL